MGNAVSEGLGSLFQNKLFLQYLSGAGADIASGKGLGPNVNAITQQNIQTQNMMKFMQQLLGPDGSKGTFSKAGVNLTIPKENAMVAGALQGGESDEAAPTSTPTQNTTPAAPASIPVQGGGSSVANPFSGNFSPSDLAGLTPQDLTAVFGMKASMEDSEADRIKEVLDRLEPSAREKYLRSLMADPKLKDIAIELARAGAINLSDKVEEKKVLSELGGQTYFNNPKWVDDVQKQVATFDKDQAWLLPEKDRPLARSKVVVRAVEDKIAAGNGTIKTVVMDKDNRTMVWTVQWPSGDIKTIKQAIR